MILRELHTRCTITSTFGCDLTKTSACHKTKIKSSVASRSPKKCEWELYVTKRTSMFGEVLFGLCGRVLVVRNKSPKY